MTLVKDSGFHADDWAGGFAPLDQASEPGVGLDLASDVDPSSLADHINAYRMIRIDFPSFADGRGFTIARQLRRMGYTGRLRAKGHVIADQYTMARRSGFDEVEIDEALAKRQPEAQWLARANWQDHDYRAALRA